MIFKVLQKKKSRIVGDIQESYLYKIDDNFNNTLLTTFVVSSGPERLNYKVIIKTTDNNNPDPEQRVHSQVIHYEC